MGGGFWVRSTGRDNRPTAVVYLCLSYKFSEVLMS